MEMLNQSFFVSIKPTSWNRIATAHWRVYKQYKDLLAQATWIAIKQAHIKPVKGQIAIEVVAHFKDKRVHDCDNVFIKAALDQLVKDGIIEADDCKTLVSIKYSGLLAQKDEGLAFSIVTV